MEEELKPLMKTLRAKLRKRGRGGARARGGRGDDDAAGGAQDHRRRRQEGLLELQEGAGNLILVEQE